MGSGKLLCVKRSFLRVGMQLVSAVLIFAAVFFLTAPTVRAYLLFFDGLWLWLLFRYGSRKNAGLFQRGIVISAGGTAAFLLFKLLSGRPIRLPEEGEWILLLLGAAEVAAGLVFCRRVDGTPEKPLPLYRERMYDFERIRNYIMEFEIVGVNAGWGKGKSFLMERLKADKKIREQFEVIQINLLSCDLDAVELILVEELEGVFQKSRVYPENSHRLKSLLGSSEWTNMLWEQLGGNAPGLSASFDGFRRELKQLPKKVLVIFEDIDRIFDKVTVQKVFAIGEYLSGKELHIVYQYDAHMLEQEAFGRDYLEKYIPYTVNLTDIPYEKLVRYSWDELGMGETRLSLDKVCCIGQHLPGLFELNRLLKLETSLSIVLGEQVSARKVRIFLSELKELMLTNEEFSKTENMETVCNIVFIKHFFDKLYAQLRIGESPLQSLTLAMEGKAYPLPQLLAELRESAPEGPGRAEWMLQRFRQVMEQPENRFALSLLLLLGYALELEQLGPGLDGIVLESENNLARREKNEKIDRIIWNVLANGTSELTNAENAIDKLYKDVLSKAPGEARELAWDQYQEDMYRQQLWKDNQTIFLIGLGAFFRLFQAMSIVKADQAMWSQFLEFYFSKYQGDAISRGLVDNLKYCNIRSKVVFIQVIRFFNQLKAVGNLNRDRAYWLFLEKYMKDAVSLGYGGSMDYWMFQCSGTAEKDLGYMQSVMKQYRLELERLKKQQEEQGFDYVAEEFSDIIRFVDKNLELMQCKSPLPERGPSVQIKDTHTSWVHQPEVDRLKELKETDPERFWEELEKSYREGKLYYPEWKELCGSKKTPSL